jgi:hypothetical protein
MAHPTAARAVGRERVVVCMKASEGAEINHGKRVGPREAHQANPRIGSPKQTLYGE